MPELTELISPYLKEDADAETILKNIEGYVETQNKEFTANLAKNRDEILDEKRKYKTERDELASKYAWMESLETPITQEGYSDMLSEMDTLKTSVSKSADEFSQQLDAKFQLGKEAAEQIWQPKLTAFETKVQELTNERDKYKTQFESFQVENALRGAVSKYGIQADEMWFNGLKNTVKPVFGEKGLDAINVPHNGSDLPIEDWLRSFVNTDTGKKMIPAGYGSGMEGNGSGSGREGGVPSIEEIYKIQDRDKRIAMMEKYGYA